MERVLRIFHEMSFKERLDYHVDCMKQGKSVHKRMCEDAKKYEEALIIATQNALDADINKKPFLKVVA